MTSEVAAASFANTFQTSPAPSRALFDHGTIKFRHPGYVEPSNIMFQLPRVDTTPAGEHGVHYETALVACQIISGNSFESGRLALDRQGERPVGVSRDGILTATDYYFFVEDGPTQYAVVPSFKDWVFPHGRIPESWPKVIASGRPDECGITRYPFPLETAHLVPKKEETWYETNGMETYDDGIFPNIDNEVNSLRLRTDIHSLFDARVVVIVPKIGGGGTPQYVTHVLGGEMAPYWPAHHNILVQCLHPGSRPYLFARFAWAILLRVKAFVSSGFSRTVFQVSVGKDGMLTAGTETVSGAQLVRKYRGGGSQEATSLSRKWTRSQAGSVRDDSSAESSDEDNSVEDLDHFWGLSRRDDSPRKRQRSSDETGPHDDRKPISKEIVPTTSVDTDFEVVVREAPQDMKTL